MVERAGWVGLVGESGHSVSSIATRMRSLRPKGTGFIARYCGRRGESGIVEGIVERIGRKVWVSVEERRGGGVW